MAKNAQLPDSRPAFGCQVLVQSEEEKQLRRQMRREEKRINKLLSKVDDGQDDEVRNCFCHHLRSLFLTDPCTERRLSWTPT